MIDNWVRVGLPKGNTTAVEHLLSIGFYDVDHELTKDMVIIDYEIRLSQEIIRLGFNFSCISPILDKIDYRKYFELENVSSVYGDVLFYKGFYGRTLSPNELIFIKIVLSILNLYET